MLKEEILKKYFGYASFREGQSLLIDHILNGDDAVGIMPTGAGKSICFQIPAMMLAGMTIVVSPLISLMRDQVQALALNGVSAAFVNSTLNAAQTKKVIENAKNGAYKIIYVAPERLDVEDFLSFAACSDISMVAIDEAHCVSQWGQDFRPSYLKINEFIDRLSKRPIITAFTATATDEIRDDVIKILRLKNPYITVTGFDRENLYFEVKKPREKYDAVINYLKDNPDKNGIIYCSTRKAVEQVCSRLTSDNYNATRYHAGLSEKERTCNQDDFLYDRKSIMVATNAFGMGIDKSNVNFVIHYNMPKNIESYYQEAGRAGRDGTNADCILLYGSQDVVTNQYFIEHNENSELDAETFKRIKEKEHERLKMMTYYCHTSECLRAYILKYFGDKSGDYCGNCGNCKQNFEIVDVLEDSKKIISSIFRMKERYGVQLIIDTLRGSRTKRILMLRLNELSTYGIMKNEKENYIREVVQYLILNKYIVLTNSQYQIVKLGEKWAELLRSNEPVLMKTVKEQEEIPHSKKSGKSKMVILEKGINQSLFASLKVLRSKIASEKNLPAFVVFSDATLLDMCRKIPVNEAEMLEVSGIGQVKFERYGKQFLSVISENSGTTENQTALLYTTEELCEFVKDNFECSEEAISVSAIADALNSLLLQKSSYKVSAFSLSKFYEKQGFLCLETINGKNNRKPTDAGKKLGISVVERKSHSGEVYTQNIYNEDAQQFACNNINELLNI